MKIYIHQPNFFPHLGFFLGIASSDIFVNYNDVQINSRGYTHRVTMLPLQGDPKWVGVGLKNKRAIIKEIPFSFPDLGAVIDQIFAYYKSYPHFEHVEKILRSLDIDDVRSLADLNTHYIRYLMKKLKIVTPMVFSSDIKGSWDNPNDRIIGICKHFSEDFTYVAGSGIKNYGGEELLSRHKLVDSSGIIYPQLRRGEFISGLSIIDVIANIGFTETATLINNNLIK